MIADRPVSGQTHFPVSSLIDLLFRFCSPKEENVIWMLLERRLRKRMTARVLVYGSLLGAVLGMIPDSVIILPLGSALFLYWCLRHARRLVPDLKARGLLEDVVFLIPLSPDDFPKAYLAAALTSMAYALVPVVAFISTEVVTQLPSFFELVGILTSLAFLYLIVGCDYFVRLKPRGGCTAGCLGSSFSIFAIVNLSFFPYFVVSFLSDFLPEVIREIVLLFVSMVSTLLGGIIFLALFYNILRSTYLVDLRQKYESAQ